MRHFLCMKACIMSMGRGKMIVEFFSAAMELRLCRYRSWRADGDSAMTREASFRALDAFISPSAAMIWNRHPIRGLQLLPRGAPGSDLSHLCPGLTTGFRLCGHSSLQLLRQLHIFDLNTFHLDAPRIRGFVQGLLHAVKIRQPVIKASLTHGRHSHLHTVGYPLPVW